MKTWKPPSRISRGRSISSPEARHSAPGARLRFTVCLVIAGLSLCFWPAPGRAAEGVVSRERLLLDWGWKFHLGNEWGTGEDLAKAGSSVGPASRDFNDAVWRTVDLPHDWAIELPFDRNSDTSHGFKPVGPGFLTNSVG